MESFFPFAATTEGVTVRVSVTFLPEQSDIDGSRWFWAYHIRIENHRDTAVQLLTRHWEISDGRGGLQMVDGDGVVGEQPIIQPGKSHDYVSGCPLNTPNGAMEGHFIMVGSTSPAFEVRIPHFPLTEPTVEQ
ncbi:Co2+/Mg2+ efflux protein ApaG [Sphingorhabdus sp. M41]|uniref:Co2+/Mg2+ efflux protein ApaG n=1 Tax=Sphingorhabdus sp. M41 TaxID=1806885 RepID=UPI00078DFD59|nr:Co2+/Mg2+ efflux protein ApaG [Sphingorhabdus sp. M41]AMO73257.1 Co2+/Mg2+ efflux protein ApaG [Sphingorhabdus sp. M41]